MKVTAAKKELEKHLSKLGLKLRGLSPEAGVEAMLGFYAVQRAEECSLKHDGDMLLYQWGTNDWGDGEFFELNITRQFIVGQGDDDDISQLSLTFRYKPTRVLRATNDGNRWCNTPGQLDGLRSFIKSSKAYRATAGGKPAGVSLVLEGV